MENRTDLGSAPQRREDALPSSLVAAHTIITVDGGKFLSMTDPPEWARPAVAECRNEGGWPVLADPDGLVVLSSPIILYDHPELADGEPGRALRRHRDRRDPDAAHAGAVRRREGRGAGHRPAGGRAAGPGRVDGSAGHGAAARDPAVTAPGRSPCPADGAAGADRGRGLSSVPWWDPDADASVSPDTDSVTIGGRPVARGSLVRLRPGARRADAQDMFLVGRVAEVQAVLHDVEDNPYLAVSLAGVAGRGPAHRARALPVLQHRRGRAVRGREARTASERRQ